MSAIETFGLVNGMDNKSTIYNICMWHFYCFIGNIDRGAITLLVFFLSQTFFLTITEIWNNASLILSYSIAVSLIIIVGF